LDEFLDHTTFLFRLKVISADGVVLFVAGAPRTSGEEEGGAYYAWRAQALGPLTHLLMPVELRVTGAGSDSARTMPAVAVLVPIRDRRGDYAGVVVGEAYASTLFAALERNPPALAGTTTGLVDAEHHLLYHSERKPTWESLLGVAPDPLLRDLRDLDSLATGSVFRTAGHLVKAEPVQLGPSTALPLTWCGSRWVTPAWPPATFRRPCPGPSAS